MTFDHSAAARVTSALLVCLCASCASPLPEREARGDVVALQASSAARIAYEQGDYALAQQLYRRALTRARAINDAALAADAAFNLAVSEVGLGQYAAADRLLRQAHYDAGRASSGTTDIQLLRAKVAYFQQQIPEAQRLIDEVVGTKAEPALALQARILRGQIFCETAGVHAAKVELQAVEKLATPAVLSMPVRADLAKLRGTVARLEGRVVDAAEFFEAEAEFLRLAHRYRDMSHALARAAEAYLASGQPALAADRFYLAARSLDGRGDTDAARTFLASSLSAADQARDDGARLRARMLLEEISRRRGP